MNTKINKEDKIKSEMNALLKDNYDLRFPHFTFEGHIF
jgi:hypothetical protein